MTISLATEVASAPKYPGLRHNARERKVLETVKTYVDAGDAAVVSDAAYAAGWNGVTAIAPSKNAVYDKINAMISDTAYAGSWNGVTDVAPSKNAVYDIVETKQNTITMNQATTGTAGTVGQIAIAGMTATGKIVVTAAEDPGTSLVISDVVAGTDLVTVWTKNTDTNARAELSGKKVNYIVIALS